MGIALTKKELANAAGYSYRRMHDIDAGLPSDKKLFIKSEGGKYDLALFIQHWVEYSISRETNADDTTLEEARAIHEQVKIEKTRIEVAKMRAELVDVNEVRRLWANIANTVVQNLMRLPNKVGQQVYMVENLDLVIGILDKEIRDCLTGIANTPLPVEAKQGGKDEDTGGEED